MVVECKACKNQSGKLSLVYSLQHKNTLNLFRYDMYLSWDLIKWFNPATLLCMSYNPGHGV